MVFRRWGEWESTASLPDVGLEQSLVRRVQQDLFGRESVEKRASGNQRATRAVLEMV